MKNEGSQGRWEKGISERERREGNKWKGNTQRVHVGMGEVKGDERRGNGGGRGTEGW